MKLGLFIDCGEKILNCIVKKVYAVLYVQYMYLTFLTQIPKLMPVTFLMDESCYIGRKKVNPDITTDEE